MVVLCNCWPGELVTANSLAKLPRLVSCTEKQDMAVKKIQLFVAKVACFSFQKTFFFPEHGTFLLKTDSGLKSVL